MSRTMNSYADSDTVSTAELLDLIQADVDDAVGIGVGVGGRPIGIAHNRGAVAVGGGGGVGARYSSGSAGGGFVRPIGDAVGTGGNGGGDGALSSTNNGDPFSVRLTQRKSRSSMRTSRRRRGTDEDDFLSDYDDEVGDCSRSDEDEDEDEDDDDDDEEDDYVGDLRGGFDNTGGSHYNGKFSNSHTGGAGGGGRAGGGGLGKRNKHINARRRGGAGGRNGNGKPPPVVANRQRMVPLLGGGYGGMFEVDSAASAGSKERKRRRGDEGGEDDGGGGGGGNSVTSSVTGGSSAGSSLSSVFSFASKFFSHHGRQASRRSRNPYSAGGVSVSSRTSRTGGGSATRASVPMSEHHHHPALVGLARRYLDLPFRLRYFVQLFSIVGVFMIASLNYFIAMDDGAGGSLLRPVAPHGFHSSSLEDAPQSGYSKRQQEQYLEGLLESQTHRLGKNGGVAQLGGGLSADVVPRLRVRDPLKFLHRDMRPNALLELARAKFRKSSRFGDTGGGGGGDATQSGPFAYGWGSMPRQVFNDYATGVSDDARTIGHKNAARRGDVGSLEHNDLDENEVGGKTTRRKEGKKSELSRSPPKGTVAYVLPVTSCYGKDGGAGDHRDSNLHPSSSNQPRDEETFRDFALMLRSTVHAHSHRNPASGSVYDYRMHALLHPRAKKCADANSAGGSRNGVVDRSVALQNLGYQVSIKSSPVSRGSVKGSEYLKEYLEKKSDVDGGEIVDLIRLYAYELEDYDAVVLVDYDTLILKPIDKAVDLIVDSTKATNEGDANDEEDVSVDVVFSWDHPRSLDPDHPRARASVVNLSFFVLRPSKATLTDLVSRYQDSPFSEAKGWGKIGRGSFPGWMTTRGFLTYYYDEVANDAKVEMNRCVFGNTGEDYDADGSTLITNEGKVECGGGEDAGGGPDSGKSQCNGCSRSKLEDVSVADLSYCRAPWECGGGDDDGDAPSASDNLLSSGLCRQFQKVWFGGRLQMEDVHPQLEKGSGQLCIDGQYQPMKLLKPE